VAAVLVQVLPCIPLASQSDTELIISVAPAVAAAPEDVPVLLA